MTQDSAATGGQNGGLPFQDPGATLFEMHEVLRRIGRLEDDVADIRAALTRVEPMFVRIDERLRHLPSAADLASLKGELGELKGRVAQLPTALQLLGFVIAIFVAAGVMRLLQG